MLLDRTCLSLAKVASREESRYTMQAILVEDGKVIATDGHKMAWCDLPAIKTDSFPTGSFPTVVEGDGVSALVASQTALAALKALPKKQTIPALEHAWLGREGDKTVLCVTDLATQTKLDAMTSGKFPNWKHILPTEPPVATFLVDPQKLISLLELAAAAYGTEYRSMPVVRLAFYGPDKTLRLDTATVDGRKWGALLMPARTDREFEALPEPRKDGISCILGWPRPGAFQK